VETFLLELSRALTQGVRASSAGAAAKEWVWPSYRSPAGAAQPAGTAGGPVREIRCYKMTQSKMQQC